MLTHASLRGRHDRPCGDAAPYTPEVSLIHAVVHALSITASMTWEITWALILGFALSAMIQALVRKSTVIRLLGNDRPRRARAGDRFRGGVLVVLVRGGRAGAVAVP